MLYLYAINNSMKKIGRLINIDRMAYKGKFKLSIGASDNMSWSRVVIIEIDDVLEIPGETITGIYNYNTGTVD